MDGDRAFVKEETQVAEKNQKEFPDENGDSQQSAVEALFERFEEQAEDPKQVQDGFAQLKKSLIQLYLDSDDLKTRSEAFVAMRDILNGAVDLEEPALPQLLRFRDDFRVWLTRLGFGVEPLDEDTAIIYGVPADEKLARRLKGDCGIAVAKVPGGLARLGPAFEEAAANGDGIYGDPVELQKFAEAFETEDPERTLKVQSVERLLEDIDRAIELEDNEAVRKALRLMEEAFELKHRML